jgi:SAM-dependent methyltransferase
MTLERARRAWRSAVPPPARRRIRRFVTDLPHRLRDAVPDLVERFSSRSPLPPARLRARVGLTSSRREFLEVGSTARDSLLAAIAEAGCSLDDYPRWLDFGCGSGRIARHLSGRSGARRVFGVDVDRTAVEWCRRHLSGEFLVGGSAPPTALAEASVDVVYAVSVLTHMDEPMQGDWLGELHRLLRPGGLLLVSTHSPELTWTRPDLTPIAHRRLREDGFLFVPAAGPFNDNSTFQSEGYLRRSWTGRFSLRLFKPFGLSGYQDLSVWEREKVLTDRHALSTSSPRGVSG